MFPDHDVTVDLFSTVLSGGKLPAVPRAEEFKNQLEPDQDFGINYSSGKDGGMEKLTFFYRSPGNVKEVISVYFGNYTVKQVKEGLPLKEIRKAVRELGIKLPKDFLI